MRNFPFKTLILCVLLPPFVYVFSIQMLEKMIQASYEKTLAEVYTGDTRVLFDGSVRLQDAIRENVDAFIASRKLTHWGVRLSVRVKTPDGDYLYPYTYDGARSGLDPQDSISIARENFRLLNDGLVKIVEVEIEHNTPISNLILFSCVALSLLVFVVFYRRGIKLIRQEDLARQQIIDNLSHERQKSLAQLQRLEDQRALLSESVQRMKTELEQERRKATAAEDEMIDELVALEEKISENLALQESQLDEIDALKEKIRQYERDNEVKTRQRLKGVEAIRKRFNALYKNAAVHDRAIEGFVELTDEMKIKAEEVIHQLNDDPKMVQIKRKVFGKKNRETVFEVIFAYKGRLYFRNIDGNRVEVLVVGTKLTQNKDLAFLDKL